MINFISNALKFSPVNSEVIISLENVQLQPIHVESVPAAII